MMFFLAVSVISSSMFILTSHPISLMLMIVVQAMNLCFVIWLLMNISWFSYIMFLIYLGGIMILFVYISSMASNEKFFISMSQMIYQIIATILISTFILMSVPQYDKAQKTEFLQKIFNLYSSSVSEILTVSMFYLLLTLIVVVKLTSFYSGPLRSKN